MEKKLPGVFANKIDKKINNNESVFYSNEERTVETSAKKVKLEKSVIQKINDIFKSRDYVYKAKVVISLKDKTIEKIIVGKNNNYVITLENELIPIQDIIDIKKST